MLFTRQLALWALSLFAVAGFSQIHAAAMVQYREEGSIGGNVSQPRLVVVNPGPGDLESPEIIYPFMVELGKTPSYQVYNAPDAEFVLENIGNGLYRLRIKLTGLVLPPGAVHNLGNGVHFGINKSDWSTWDFSQDPCYIQTSGALVVNECISVEVPNQIPVSSSSSQAIGTVCNSSVLYDGAQNTHVNFSPYNWPEPYELLANHGVQGGGLLQPYMLRLSGSKQTTGDWLSLYNFPQIVDFTNTQFSISIDASHSGNWGFYLEDDSGNKSGIKSISIVAQQGIRVSVGSNDFEQGTWDPMRIMGVGFGPLAVPSNQYMHIFLDDISLGCADIGISSSSSQQLSSSSSSLAVSSSSSSSLESQTGTWRVIVFGSGGVHPADRVVLAVGQSTNLQFEAANGYKIAEVLVDGQARSVQNNGIVITGDGLDHEVIVRFIPDMGSMHVVRVTAGPNGNASMSGANLLLQGSDYTIHFFPNPGYQIQTILLDEVEQPKSERLTLTGLAADHQISVTFVARVRSEITLDVSGPGRGWIDGNGAYVGDNALIFLEADPGAKLSMLEVDGLAQPLSLLHKIPQIGASHQVRAQFEAYQGEQCPLVVQSQNIMDVHSRNRVVLQAVSAVASGWKWEYFFRAVGARSPVMDGWYVPTSSYRVDDIGGGYFRIEFSPDASLSPGQSIEAQFGLRYSDYSPWNVQWELSAIPNSQQLTANNKIVVRNASGQILCGELPRASSGEATLVRAQALYYDEGMSDNILRPRIAIQNTGNVPISDFYAMFFFQVPAGQVPQLQNWYSPHQQVSLVSFGGGLYALRLDYSGVTLLPGETLTPPPGSVVGVHLVGWGAMDRSDDWSHDKNAGQQLRINPLIPIYDKNGNLLGGTPPLIPETGTPGQDGPGDIVIARQPENLILEEGQTGIFSVEAVAGRPLQYRWMRDGLWIEGATNRTLDVGPVTLGDAGSVFRVQVSNGLGHHVLSESATLGVQSREELPLCVKPVRSITVRDGSTALFKGEGFSPGQLGLQYRWSIGGGASTLTAEPILEVPASLADNGKSVSLSILQQNGGIVSCGEAQLVVLPQVSTRNRITLEGNLTSGASPAGVDGVQSVTLRLFAASRGGDPVYIEKFWKSNDMGISFSRGRWSLQLGTGDSRHDLRSVFLGNSSLFAEVLVGPENRQEVAGERMPIHATAWAHHIEVLRGGTTPTMQAPVGTLYLDTSTYKIWIRTQGNWEITQ